MSLKTSGFKLDWDFTAVILAGGRSRRFGSPKSNASFGGKNLITIAIDLAIKICDRVIVIQGDEINPLHPEIKSYRDILDGKGPLGGIQSALTFCETENIVVLPVDMPLLCSDIYKHLASNRNMDKPVVAISQKGMEPLVSIWFKSNLTTINRSIENNNLSLWSCLEKLNTTKIEFAKLYPEIPEDCFYNINTKEDLELLNKLMIEDKTNKQL